MQPSRTLSARPATRLRGSIFSSRILNRKLALLAMLLGFILSCNPAFAAALDFLNAGAPKIDGGSMDYLEEEGAIIIRGYGVATKGEFNVRARNLVYFQGKDDNDNGEVYAEGDVVAQFPGMGALIYCDSIIVNLNDFTGEATGLMVAGSMPEDSGEVIKPTDVNTELAGPGGRKSSWDENVVPFNRGFVRANKVRSNSATHQELFGASLTSDNSPSPIYHISSAAAHLRSNEKVESWHNVFWLGKVPIFYFPYIIKDLRYDWPWMRFAAGHDSDWGNYTLTTFGLDLNPSDASYFRLKKIFFDIDWRAERGWAGGPSLKYEMGHLKSSGRLETYYTKESSIGDSEDWERSEEDQLYEEFYADEERYKIEWEHYQDLPGEWDLRAEAHYFSDRDFQKEYFNRDFNEDKEPESVLDLRKLNDNYVFEILAKKRVNDFQSQEEYLPEMRFTLPGYRIGDTDFYVRNDTRVGVINKRFDERMTDDEIFDQYETRDNDFGNAFRAHTDLRVYRPIPLGEIFAITPYAGGLATYYEELQDDSDGNARIAGLYGAAFTGRLYGLYNNGQMRHVLEPTISYTANEDPTIEPEDLWQVDELDLYRELHYLTLKLHQEWQIKRNNRTVSLVDLDISTRYLPYDREAEDVLHGHHWTPIAFDLVYRPTDDLTFSSDLEWDTEDNQVTSASARIDWIYHRLLRTSLSQRYNRGDTTLAPYSDKSNETTFAIRWVASDKYIVEYAVSYEWAESKDDIDHGLSKQRISLIRNLKVFEMTLSLMRDARRDDTAFYMTLSPIGIAPLERASSVDDIVSRQAARYNASVRSEEAAVDALDEAILMP
ncbi:MAG: LPS assembly protein LptD [Planctomycetes bacterium]|nr:LPS assembly protein LptD [Planctomycetota bacterium]